MVLSSALEHVAELRCTLAKGNVFSVFDMQRFFPTAQMLADLAAEDNHSLRHALQLLWHEADTEYEEALLASARARRVARKWSVPCVASIDPVPSACLSPSSAAGVHSAPRRSSRSCSSTVVPTDAEAEEEALLNYWFEQAYALVELVGHASRRNRDLEDAMVPVSVRKHMYRALFTHKATVASTLREYIRCIQWLQRWTAGKGYDTWRLSAVQIAYFIKDEGRTGKTVPPRLLRGLQWFQSALVLPWELKDDLIVSFANMSARAAEAQREQAKPYTHDDVTALLALHFANRDNPAWVLATGFILALAFGCLRWADLFRSKHLALPKDTVFGTSWRVKRRGAALFLGLP